MKDKLLLLVVGLLFTGCATNSEPYKPNKWNYMGPEHVTCPDRHSQKLCRKHGIYMICECAYA